MNGAFKVAGPTPGEYTDLDILLPNGETDSYSLLKGRDDVSGGKEGAILIVRRDDNQAVLEKIVIPVYLRVKERKRTVAAPAAKPTLITQDGFEIGAK